jgi:hypothetical protein
MSGATPSERLPRHRGPRNRLAWELEQELSTQNPICKGMDVLHLHGVTGHGNAEACNSATEVDRYVGFYTHIKQTISDLRRQKEMSPMRGVLVLFIPAVVVQRPLSLSQGL